MTGEFSSIALGKSNCVILRSAVAVNLSFGPGHLYCPVTRIKNSISNYVSNICKLEYAVEGKCCKIVSLFHRIIHKIILLAWRKWIPKHSHREENFEFIPVSVAAIIICNRASTASILLLLHPLIFVRNEYLNSSTVRSRFTFEEFGNDIGSWVVIFAAILAVFSVLNSVSKIGSKKKRKLIRWQTYTHTEKGF